MSNMGKTQPADSFSDLAIAQALLRAEAKAVENLSASLTADPNSFHGAVNIITTCAQAQGSVLVSGVGKSGLIGAKISATLASLGVPSHFVHPTEAAHGDLGNFRSADVCIAISYSGQTDEVINLAAALRQDAIPVIAMCAGTPDHSSALERVSTITLAIGRADDLSPSPAPMCSTTATLALGDALALCASQRLGFTASDFARRHPGGALGGQLKPITEALRFVVGSNLHPVPDDVSVGQALALADVDGRRPGAMVLVDRTSGVLTGLFTDGDLRRQIVSEPKLLSKPVREVMTRKPATLSSSALVRDAVHMIQETRRDEIPVVDHDGKPVGILDVQDLVTMRLVRP
jgi:arabinose-5-phosphate isomerase